MTGVPLEAWSVDGISASASSLENPLVMDTMTANMCHNGMGRLDFARVLVEMDADKEFKQTIEVQYRDKNNKSTKNRTAINGGEEQAGWRNVGNQQNRYKDKGKQKEVRPEQVKSNMGQFGRRWEYRRKQGERMENEKEQNDGNNAEPRKKWPLQTKEFEAMKKTANKYS
ncbi:hypothetical protein Tco_1343421 [Tanacetum coccineum]